MLVREPVVAGQFYPDQPGACQAEIDAMIAELSQEPDPVPGNSHVNAGIVPHAGWVCSGKVAARVFRSMAMSHRPQVLVLFGGVHRYRGSKAAMFDTGRWETPIGPVDVDCRLAERILGHTNMISCDPHAHVDEHSLEVQMPLIRHFFPDVRVLPIMVPVVQKAGEIGKAIARTLNAYDYDALVIGTTDLTHYGPTYGFSPRDQGEPGFRWAREVNDRSFIDMVCAMDAEGLVVEAHERRNACNPGATAATIAAAKALGASRGILLEHTSSAEVLAQKVPEQQSDSVGYAGIIFT